MKEKMIGKLVNLQIILERRKNRLAARLAIIDNLPNSQITNDTYRQWHEVYGKIGYLELRLAKIKEEIDILCKRKDLIADFIAGSKGLFTKLAGIRG